MKPIVTDDLLDQVSRIYERARVEVLTLLRTQEPAPHLIVAPRDWMSATQLAEYWQLYNENDGRGDRQTSFRYLTLTWVTS